MPQFQISESHKFALLGVVNVYTDFRENEFQLSNGAWVLNMGNAKIRLAGSIRWRTL